MTWLFRIHPDLLFASGRYSACFFFYFNSQLEISKTRVKGVVNIDVVIVPLFLALNDVYGDMSLTFISNQH